MPIDAHASELMFNQLSRTVLILNPEGEVLYLNPAAERLWGVSLNMALNHPLAEILTDGDKLLPWVLEAMTTSRTIKIREMKLATPRGEHLVDLEIAPVGPGGTPWGAMVLLDELSLHQALQEENRVMDRLSMMGTLASGLAHEIRNPLGGIRAAAEMLEREAASEESKEFAGMIISEADRVNQLVTQLLDFSRPKKLKKQKLNINQLLSELLILQEPDLERRGIQLKQEFDPSLPLVLGDPASLKQSFLNLIKNALEAMEGGGTLKVSTSFFADYHLLLGEGRVGHMALVKIKDTGPGIKAEVLKSLFTPFFTTKKQGTGLGLMITQRIIKEHDGLLRLQTEIRKGTTFQVYLKLAKG